MNILYGKTIFLFPTKKRIIIDVNYIIKFVLCPVFTAVNRASEFHLKVTQPISVLACCVSHRISNSNGPIVFDSLNYIIIHTYYSGFIVIYYIRYDCWYILCCLCSGRSFFIMRYKNELYSTEKCIRRVLK